MNSSQRTTVLAHGSYLWAIIMNTPPSDVQATEAAWTTWRAWRADKREDMVDFVHQRHDELFDTVNQRTW